MNLRNYLLLRILASVGLCFLLAAGAVLRQTAARHGTQLRHAADALATQLRLQRLGLTGGGETPAWDTAIRPLPGMCAQYVKADGSIGKNVCYGLAHTADAAPSWFATLYATLFRPVSLVHLDLPALKGALVSGKRDIGSVVVTRDPAVEVTEAWAEVRALLILTSLIVVVLCLLTYLIVQRALLPMPRILDVLTRIGRRESFARLPAFEIAELRALGKGINTLGNDLETSHRERSQLMRTLLTLQEDERRSLARELHDEFGQSLAAINAVASSIAYTADTTNPAIAEDAKRIQASVDHIMILLRGMLRRLRPQGLDDQGLTDNLKRLLTEWQDRLGDQTRFTLNCSDELGDLPEPLVVNLYRVVQECLTNVARHADASMVQVTLARRLHATADAPGPVTIELVVEDDGVATREIGTSDTGMGLLGMRERVALLGGTLTVEARKPSGLRIHAIVPLESTSPPGPVR